MSTLIKKCTPIIVALTLITIFSCTKYEIPGKLAPETKNEPGTDPSTASSCDPDTIYFQNSILPLVVSSCGTTGCHDQDSHREGIILTDYASIISTGKIKAGNPKDSKLFESLTEEEEDRMPPPPYDPLSSDQIDMIRQWIVQGAKNNACSDGCDTSVSTFAGQVWPIMDSYCTGCHSTGTARGGVVIAE